MLSILDPGNSARASLHVPPGSLDDDAVATLDAEGNVRRWIDNLVAAGRPDEALRILTRVLPRKYALAWGCECLRQVIGGGAQATREVDRAGVALAERWLATPTEEHRRAALDFAERGDFASAGAWIAAAAGWAEGSLAPKGYDAVPPPDSLTGEAVCAAMLTAAMQVPAENVQRLNSFVARAVAAFGTPPPTGQGAAS